MRKSTTEDVDFLDKSSSAKRSVGLLVEGYPVEGLSIGGQETCVIFSSLRMAFDIGRCPQRAISQHYLFISHGHLDHIYVETRPPFPRSGCMLDERQPGMGKLRDGAARA
ncbi:Nuclear ribonuclease Z [Platanthera guangdongensis]|uniref:Nuclear ribonuclease Z n=1 Tax=Platanthera guangdongensis TaxID=2320717 RepID=A0ABR2M3N8_9ASPA